MKNKFRVFLCLLFAVILPFSFVGCGKKDNANNDAGAGIETPGTNNPPQENPGPEISYVLDESETLRILETTNTFLDGFVVDMNENSEILEEKEYQNTVGDLTAGAFNYLNYPLKLISGITMQLQAKSKQFKLGQIYAHIPATGVYRYFQIDAIDNNEININIVSKDTKEYVYFKFRFLIDEGNLNAIKLSRLETPSAAKKIEFMDVLFDAKNSNLEACFGNLVNYSSASSKFFADNFTEEKFDDILDSCWSYSCYEKLPIKTNTSFECQYKSMDNVLVQHFLKFDFLDAFNKYSECMALSNDKLVGLNSDIIQIIEPTINVFSYAPEKFRFEKNV